MFGFFKRKPADDEPMPTEKQLRYAATLKLVIPPGTTRAKLSAMISRAELAEPRHVERRERITRKPKQSSVYSEEAMALEERWLDIASNNGYAIVVYKRGQNVIADVLLIMGADLTEKNKVKIEVASPKLIKEKGFAPHLDWEKEFILPAEAVLHCEPLHDGFHHDGVEAYRKAVERGMAAARRL